MEVRFNFDVFVRKFLYCLLGIALIFSCCGLVGCSAGKNSTTNDNNKELKKVTFVLDYTPNTNHLGLYVAKSKGWFEEAGFNVDIQQPPADGADSLVGSGVAQFGISFQDWMASYLGSDDAIPVSAVAAICQHNTSSLLSLKSKNMSSPKDFAHKTYGSMDVATENAIIKNLVESAGVNWEDVNVVSNSAVDELQGLKSNLFDFVWSYDAWGVLKCKQAGEQVNTISIAEQNPAFDYYTPVIIANNDYLANNSDDAKGFLDVIARGYKFASENPRDAAKILCESDPTIDLEFASESAELISKQFLDEEGNFGKFDEARWSRFYEWMNENDLTQNKLNVRSGFTNDYLGK